MANEEYKTTVISYDERQPEIKVAKEETVKPNLQNILFNVTTKVPHVTQTLPTVKVETEETTTKVDLRSIEKINKHGDALPRFYIREYKRSGRLVALWGIITAICAALEIWAMVAIIQSNVSNWACLTLIPAITLCVAFFIIYLNNWLNFRNEARNVDFTQGKIPTISVMKLYKRLKTAHINVNWFCGLTYIGGGLAILITYIVGWAIGGCRPEAWGVLDPNYGPFVNTCGSSLLITVIVCAAAMIIAFFLHVILLVTNYTRAAKIDNFYSVQIVSDEELTALKKKKNKRDLIIFLAVIMVIVLVGLLIYKLVKSRKVNNTVTINN
ncbi:MAG: MSC_0882 family membrane protein [Mycoplasmoidaceae bacterium]